MAAPLCMVAKHLGPPAPPQTVTAIDSPRGACLAGSQSSWGCWPPASATIADGCRVMTFTCPQVIAHWQHGAKLEPTEHPPSERVSEMPTGDSGKCSFFFSFGI